MNNRQLQFYEYIKHFLARSIYSPSLKEIIAPVDLKSVSSLHGHLGRLKDKGYIDFINSSLRTLQIIQ